jgi:hypothetical protein
VSILDTIRAGTGVPARGAPQNVVGGFKSAGAVAGTSALGKQVANIQDLKTAGLTQALSTVNGDTVLGKAILNTAAQFGIQVPRKRPQRVESSIEYQRWTAPPLWGGLTKGEVIQAFNDHAMLAKAWKNLFHVEITEKKASQRAPNGVPTSLSLLAMDVTFTPITMPGEVTQFGGANMDHLTTTDRVEMQIVTMDDAVGTIKRWFDGKADQVAHSDGTFGLPADYLLKIKVSHMDPLNQVSDVFRFKNEFLMRPSGRAVELSRRDQALEEMQLSFVQFDSFLKAT